MFPERPNKVEQPIITNKPAEIFLSKISQRIGETPETLARNLLQEEKHPVESTTNVIAAFAAFAETSSLFQRLISLTNDLKEQHHLEEPLLLLKAEESSQQITDIQELLFEGDKISISDAIKLRKAFASIALEWQKAGGVQSAVKSLPLELDMHRTLVSNVIFRKPDLLQDLSATPMGPALTCFFRKTDAAMLRFLSRLLIGQNCLMIGLLDSQIPEQAYWREKWSQTKTLDEFRVLLRSGLQEMLLSIIQSQREEWEKSFLIRYKENPNFDWKSYDDALITGENILKTTLSLL